MIAAKLASIRLLLRTCRNARRRAAASVSPTSRGVSRSRLTPATDTMTRKSATFVNKRRP
jgi:hypothetical protein